MKSCPFCKSERVGLYADMVSGVTFGQCMNCGAQGPLCSTSDSSDAGPIKKWDQWSEDDLRQSVRRLAEKWTESASKHEESFRRTGSSTSGLLSDIYESNSKELSALIDGKGEQQ